MSRAPASGAPLPLQVDVAIVTILPEEYETVQRCLKNVQRDPGTKDQPNQYAWVVGEIEAAQGGVYQVALAMTLHPGNASGSLGTSKTIARWNPRYVLLVGIAGGLPREQLSLGDVVVSKQIVSYEYGKVDHNAFKPRPDFIYQLDAPLLRNALAHSLGEANWRSNLGRRPGTDRGKSKVVVGMVASGEKVIDDRAADFFAAVERLYPKLVAVEMEGAGAAAAIQEASDEGRTIGFLMIRGISDMPPGKQTGTKNPARGAKNDAPVVSDRDHWKYYAANAAASFAVSFISQAWPLPPGSKEPENAPSDGSPEGAPAPVDKARRGTRGISQGKSSRAKRPDNSLSVESAIGRAWRLFPTLRGRPRAFALLSVFAAVSLFSVFMGITCTYRGTVYNATTGQIQGVRVLLSGTDCATITDQNGYFELKCSMWQVFFLRHSRVSLRTPESDTWCPETDIDPFPRSMILYLSLASGQCSVVASIADEPRSFEPPVDGSAPESDDASVADGAAPSHAGVCTTPKAKFLLDVLRDKCSSSFGSDRCVGEFVRLIRGDEGERYTFGTFPTLSLRFVEGNVGSSDPFSSERNYHLDVIKSWQTYIDSAKIIIVIGTSTGDFSTGRSAKQPSNTDVGFAVSRADYVISLLHGSGVVQPILKVVIPASDLGSGDFSLVSGATFGSNAVDTEEIRKSNYAPYSRPAAFVIFVPCQ
jgi:nucleoside phosphorylase